ncbi:MAG: hypothetical protein KF749_10380 [Bacteroidetes bacterium]|nr:hypothetical protein [Bacteroidota bacterium]MCW5895828.1 hypothetical protein [Bacteroidota bacterium]
MVRSLMAGDTDYSSQTLSEMSGDLKQWIHSLRETCKTLKGVRDELQQSGYWDNVYAGFKDLIVHCMSIYDRAANEIQEVVSELTQEIQSHHVARLRSIGDTARGINQELGQMWHREYPQHLMDYENSDFRKVEKLYCESRDMAAGMLDLKNLATRLENFIGKKMQTENSRLGINQLIELKPNFFGIGLNINALIHRIFRKH